MRAASSSPGFEATVADPVGVRALERALDEARASERRFRALVESIDAIAYIAEWDARGTTRYISPRVSEILGYPPALWYAGPDPWQDNLHPGDAERVLALSAQTFAEGRDFECEYRIFAADGRVVWIAERERIVRDAAGTPQFCHGVMFDVTGLKETEARLRDTEAALRAERDRAQTYLDVARTVLLVLDRDETVRLLNQHGHELLGHEPGALVGRNWFDVAIPAHRREADRAAFRAAMALRPFPADATDHGQQTELLTRTGRELTISWRSRALLGDDGTATGVLTSGEDITEQLRAEAEIRRLAFADPLTGLANRTHFDEELRAAVAAGGTVGLLYADLDGFKEVNDTLGHGAGDDLLREVARRLDGLPGATLVSRHGGDEFVALLTGLPDDEAAARAVARRAAEACAERLADPVTVAGTALRPRASLGTAVAPFDAADAEALLRRADAAMYRSKGRSSQRSAGR